MEGVERLEFNNTGEVIRISHALIPCIDRIRLV